MHTMRRMSVFATVAILLICCFESMTACFANNDCENKGVCGTVQVNGTDVMQCFCPPGWRGPSCNILTCDSDCNSNGDCNESTGECTCIPGWSGKSCHHRETCPNSCSGHGACSGQCFCKNGWSGIDCATPTCPLGLTNAQKCSGRGRCAGGKCICKLGWHGESCDQKDGCKNDCRGRGTCECTDEGSCTCNCFDGFAGKECEEMKCVDETCHSHGVCHRTGACLCEGLFYGSACQFQKCVSDCSGQGKCSLDGVCSCNEGYTGDICQSELCPSSCNWRTGNGECTASGCKCTELFEGAACDTPRPPPPPAPLPDGSLPPPPPLVTEVVAPNPPPAFSVKPGDFVVVSAIETPLIPLQSGADGVPVCGTKCFDTCSRNEACGLPSSDGFTTYEMDGATFVTPVATFSPDTKDVAFLKASAKAKKISVADLLTLIAEDEHALDDLKLPSDVEPDSGDATRLSKDQKTCLYGCVVTCINNCAQDIRSLPGEERDAAVAVFEGANGFGLFEEI